MRKERSTDHPQVPTNVSGIKVDRDMWPLIRELWIRGVITTYSCQGYPKFVDQTEWDAKRYRAYIQLDHDEKGMAFIVDLLSSYQGFKNNHISWDIEFDWNPGDPKHRRICIRFPHEEIAPLVKFLHYKNEVML